MDVRIAAPRRRLPGWAWVLGGVLLANLLVLAWLLLRTPKAAVVMPAPATAATAPAAAAPAIIAQVAPTPAAPAPVYVVPAPALTQGQSSLPPAQVPPLSSPPATTPASAPESALDVEGLPTYQDLIAAGISLPPLALNLHVYDANPGNRYVLLNAMRLREGDFTPDGIRLERITPRGAVLDLRGRRFLLSAGG
jgi:hypothetical protein